MSTKVGQLEIELAANVARLTTDFAAAKSEVNKSVSSMQHSVHKMQEDMEKSMEKIKGGLEKMVGLFALGFASESVVEGARHIAEYADEIDKSSQKTGIAAEKLQGLQFAAKMSDISSKDLDNSLKKLAKAMEGTGVAGSQTAAAFTAVGIKATDLKGMKTDEALAKIADSFAASKDGAGKAAVAMQLFGKSGTDMIPFLNKGSGSINELIVQAQKMGLVMSGDALDAAGRLDDQFKLMDAQIQGLQRSTSMALVPAFLQITNAFSASTEQGGALSGMFDGLGDILILITKAGSYLAQMFNAIGITIGATAAAVVAAVHGDFTVAKNIIDQGDQAIAESTKKFEAFRATLEKPVNAPTMHKEPSGDGKKKDLSLNGPGNAPSHIAAYKTELEARKEAEGNYFKTSLADDEAFWQQKLAHVAKGSKDDIAIRHELFGIHKQLAQQSFAADQESIKAEIAAARVGGAERINLATEAARRVGETYGWDSKEYQASIKEIKKAADEWDKEQQKLDLLKVSRSRDHALAQIGMAQDHLALMKNLGQVSDMDEIAQLQQFENQKYQIEVQAQQDKIALMKNEGSAKQQQLDELAKMQDKHEAEMAKLDGQRALAVKKNWDTALGAVSSAFEQSINGMIQGTQTMQKAMANMAQSIEAEFVKMGVKRVTAWIADEAAMLFASKAKDTAVAASGTTGAQAAVTQKSTEALAVVSGNAAEGATGAAAAVAPIPVVGPGMAIAAFASTMAMLLGAKSMIHSSAGGEWNIPSDRLNLVHKNETILPADIAGKMRNMVEGGGSMGGEPVHIHTGGGDFIRTNDLAKLLTQMKRNFVIIP